MILKHNLDLCPIVMQSRLIAFVTELNINYTLSYFLYLDCYFKMLFWVVVNYSSFHACIFVIRTTIIILVTHSMKFSKNWQCAIFIVILSDTYDAPKNMTYYETTIEIIHQVKIIKNLFKDAKTHVQLKYHFVIVCKSKRVNFSFELNMFSLQCGQIHYSLISLSTPIVFAAIETILEAVQHTNIVLIVRLLMNMIIRLEFNFCQT